MANKNNKYSKYNVARKIELEIPVEIYNQILDKVEELRADTEKKIAELKNFEMGIVKTINEDREQSKKSISDFESLMKKYIEKKDVAVSKDLENKLKSSINEIDKKQKILEISIKKNFENEGRYVMSSLKNMDMKLIRLKNDVSNIKELNKSFSSNIKKLIHDTERMKKIDSIKDEKIKKMEEEIKLIKKELKMFKSEIRGKVSLYEKNPLERGLKKMESVEKTKNSPTKKKEIKKKKSTTSKKKIVRKKNDIGVSLLQRILPFVKQEDKNKELKIEKKIESIRRRKKGKNYVISIAHLLRDIVKQRYGIKEQLTYNELIDRLGKESIPKDVKDQIKWFFKEIQKHEYSGELDESYFPDLDKWAIKVAELINSENSSK